MSKRGALTHAEWHFVEKARPRGFGRMPRTTLVCQMAWRDVSRRFAISAIVS